MIYCVIKETVLRLCDRIFADLRGSGLGNQSFVCLQSGLCSHSIPHSDRVFSLM